MEFFKLSADVLEKWRRIGYPPNWDCDVDHEAATALVAQGWPLTWVPRSEIVNALLAAKSDSDRDRILLENVDDLLDDCEQALVSIEQSELDFFVSMAIETLATARDRRLKPVQAASATLVESVCRQFWGLDGPAIRNQESLDVYDLPISQFFWGLCMVALAAVFTRFYPATGEPIPTRYNRHATVHVVGPDQYTDVNSLCALLSAVSLLCQADADLTAGRIVAV